MIEYVLGVNVKATQEAHEELERLCDSLSAGKVISDSVGDNVYGEFFRIFYESDTYHGLDHFETYQHITVTESPVTLEKFKELEAA